MFKMLVMMKRRAGMSMKEFIEYYESTHSKIGEKHLRGNALKYVRKYLNPLPNVLTGEINEAEYDAVMEMWFEGEARWKAAMAIFTSPEVAKALIEDEERLFDRTRIRIFIIEEHESSLA